MPAACARPESSMRVFLTGASGVIGRRLLPLLVGLDHSVTAVVPRPQSRGEIERAGAVPVQVDLFARAATQRAVAGIVLIALNVRLHAYCAGHQPHLMAKRA